MTHQDACTFLKNVEDQDILTRRLFDVNMRLFRDNPKYRGLIQWVAGYIKYLATTEREGYKKPHGYSGANAGIPFNIIALADGTMMINPKIVNTWGGTKIGESNCGSLLLVKPIRVKRYANVQVNYYSLDGLPCTATGYLPTVQHEIDHNNGILITDRQVE